MITRTWPRLALFIMCSAWLSMQEAHAYIDPGTGSVALQAILGALLAGGFFFRRIWGRLTAGFRSALSSKAREE